MSDESLKDQIRKSAKRLLEEVEGKGILTSEIHRKVREETNINLHTIQGNWHSLSRVNKSIGKGKDNDIVEMDRGLYRLAKFDSQNISDNELELEEFSQIKSSTAEKEYYKYFAEYLENEEICFPAIPIGEKLLNEQWTNPDVIGIKSYRKGLSNFKIVTAEIKNSSSTKEILTGFGQCCAYKLFSHKVYFVIPTNVKIERRIAVLCNRHNIGLVLFDAEKDLNDIDWDIRNEPYFEEPDYDFVESMLEKLGKDTKIKKLFNPYI